jgi:hypothetical protein
LITALGTAALAIMLLAGTDSAGARKPGRVLLPVKHQPQLPFLCVPTSASMALEFYGAHVSPVRLKALATPPDSKFQGTYFRDMVRAMRALGYPWSERDYAVNRQGFAAGLRRITASLDRGRPVLVDLRIPPVGHTVLVTGYDRKKRKLVYVDPAAPAPGRVTVSFARFKKMWRSVIANCRAAIYTAPKAKRGRTTRVRR